jgi:glycosyltransferase involved in cell wall biosynthesis
MSVGKRFRRVLLVTSTYAPVTTADMHRVRHLAWELPKLGWEAEVLAPNVEFQRPENLESGSARLFNPEVPVHEVVPHDLWFFHPLKIRSIGWRALRPLHRAGIELLRRRQFDLIYISTAHFVLFCLGNLWARKFNIPYVLDYHDPWVRDTIRYRTTQHTFKFGIGMVLSRWMEPYAVKGAGGIVSVSPVYLLELRERYGDIRALQGECCEVIPFAGSERDFIMMNSQTDRARTGNLSVSYVGAGGSIMAKSFSMICAVLAEARHVDPPLLARVKIRLYGTDTYWKDGDPRALQDIASRFGLADMIEEIPPRISYRKAMEIVQDSDGLMLLGVDDKGYVPSKLFTFALAGKPLLACFHSDSPPVHFFDQMPGLGNLMTFNGSDALPTAEAVGALRKFLIEVGRRERFDRSALIADYLASAMARKHIALFERVCSGVRGT